MGSDFIPKSSIYLDALRMSEAQSNQPSDDDEFAPVSISLAFHGIAAGTFDFLHLEERIDAAVGKERNTHPINFGAVVKALVMQLLSGQHQTLASTAEYFSNTPLCALLRRQVVGTDLTCELICEVLETLSACSPDKLYLACASEACQILGENTQELRTDHLAFHGNPSKVKADGSCSLSISRECDADADPSTLQFMQLALTNARSTLPLYVKGLTVGVSNEETIFSMVTHDWPLLTELHPDLRYLIGGSELCDPNFLQMAQDQGFDIITRLPDDHDLVKYCLDLGAEGEFHLVDERDPEGYSAMWCGNRRLEGFPVKLLLVHDEKQRLFKEKTVKRRAQKDKEKLESELTVFESYPATNRAEVTQELNKIVNKHKFCKLQYVTYEVLDNPANNGRKSSKLQSLTYFKVKAEVAIREEEIEQEVQRSIRFVIATTDTQREWSMLELVDKYLGQTEVGTSWQIFPESELTVDAAYVANQKRIKGLTFVLALAQLVYSVTEYILRDAGEEVRVSDISLLKEQQKPVPPGARKRRDATSKDYLLTLKRFKEYTQSCFIIIWITENFVKIVNTPDQFLDVISAMGTNWKYYYQDSTYAFDAIDTLYEGKLRASLKD